MKACVQQTLERKCVFDLRGVQSDNIIQDNKPSTPVPCFPYFRGKKQTTNPENIKTKGPWGQRPWRKDDNHKIRRHFDWNTLEWRNL